MPFPDFPDVLEIAAAAYEENGKKDDSLIEVLRDLSDFDLFWRHGSETPPKERVSNRTMLIDVHAMPMLKELVAYLVILTFPTGPQSYRQSRSGYPKPLSHPLLRMRIEQEGINV